MFLLVFVSLLPLPLLPCLEWECDARIQSHFVILRMKTTPQIKQGEETEESEPLTTSQNDRIDSGIFDKQGNKPLYDETTLIWGFDMQSEANPN